ncbi:MAG: aspartyl protease family protein, partial [Bacteroidota bacterium]|nr:aspartyl protease family protein [Bacteroidota bacterium]
VDAYPDSLNFVLDTGSGGISLDSATCEYLKIKKEQSNIMIKGIAGMRAVEFAYNHTLNLPGLVVKNLDFHVSDYDILTSVYGMKIDGIIGYSFLHRYVVAIDYEKSRLEILSKGFYKYPRGGYVLHPKFSTLPIQQISLKEKHDVVSSFYFDTGAGLCFLLSDKFADDSAVFKANKKMYPTLAQGLGGKAEMNVTTLKEVKIGPYKFRNVPTYIFNDPYNATSYPQVSGLIGNDLMRRFTVILNYTEREIFIKPNSFFRDSFDYSYTGLGIYMVENKIVVLDIMKGSPAEKAGLQLGDVIVSVNKDFSGNIQTYKAMLQSAKSIQTIFISRENAGLLKINLKVKSIFR